MRVVATTVAVATGAALLVGCGSGGSAGDDAGDVAAVRAAFDRFGQAVNAGNFARACASYTDRARQRLVDDVRRMAPEVADCPAALAYVAARLPEQRHRLADVVVDGDVATARNVGSPSSNRVLFRRVDGLWKVDGPAPRRHIG